MDWWRPSNDVPWPQKLPDRSTPYASPSQRPLATNRKRMSFAGTNRETSGKSAMLEGWPVGVSHSLPDTAHHAFSPTITLPDSPHQLNFGTVQVPIDTAGARFPNG